MSTLMISAQQTHTHVRLRLYRRSYYFPSRESRWNSITPRTLHAVEQAIVNAGTEAGILERVHNPGDNPLDRVTGVAQSGLTRLDLLQTTEDGHGWRDDGFHRYSPLPASVPYVHCQRRQLVATHLEHTRTIETGESSEAFNVWQTRAGVYDFLSALHRGHTTDVNDRR